MSNSLPTRMPVAVRLGVPLAAALLAAACGASSSSGGSGSGASASATSSAAATVISTKSVSAGRTYLTDGSGRTVYLWSKDSMNKSACSIACTSHWSPVSASGGVTASGGAKASDLGTITRSDGTKQVTYDGHPLYYYFGDSGPGQTNGEGSDDFGAQWWMVAPSGARITGASPSAPASSSPSKSGSTGSWG
jgi:predicted lipoprotein with Yx(FWY)xxD motif